MKDIIVLALMVVGLAALATAHVTIAVGLMFRPPRWRAGVAFVLLPLAPYWAFREGMRARGGVWVGSLLVYAVACAVGAK